MGKATNRRHGWQRLRTNYDSVGWLGRVMRKLAPGVWRWLLGCCLTEPMASSAAARTIAPRSKGSNEYGDGMIGILPVNMFERDPMLCGHIVTDEPGHGNSHKV